MMAPRPHSFVLHAAVWLASAIVLNAAAIEGSSTSSAPDYFQTTPELFAGPTPTGQAPFLAAYNPATWAGGASYVPNAPLQTQVPIWGNSGNENIFQMHGQLSHYFPNPIGFGVQEYPLPEGAEITYLHMLSRHGSRYPTTGSGVETLAESIKNASGQFNATADMAFLNTWQYKLGAEILVPVGKQELFDSGTLHYYMYGHLYPNNGTKIIARSTTEDRMTQSAEYFLAGFFGLGWTKNATLELIIEESGFNNSLAGYNNCPASNDARSSGGNNATNKWASIYLDNATKRIQQQITGFNWTVADSYNAQSMCAYETVALGYSPWCAIFSFEEWQGYEYSVDINFAGNNAFQSPTGRAVGIGYVQEILARIQHHLIDGPLDQVNYTLDGQESTFPLNQSLNFDFSHDTNIMSILTAFGFTQFAPFLPDDHIVTRDLVVSHCEPFGARLDIEIIQAPHPVKASRVDPTNLYDKDGKATTYIHFILNQRTLPLGKSFSECGDRDDGWCELGTFLKVQNSSQADAQFEKACFSDYDPVPYGEITNGVPL